MRARYLPRLCLSLALGLGSLGWVASGAAAERGFFAFGGGSSVQTVRSETDIFLNPIEVKNWKGNWQAGVGMRLSSKDTGRIAGQPRWETRIRLAYLQGSMEDVRIDFTNTSTQTDPYSWTSRESFEYEGFTLGASVLARVHERIGVFLGPSIERVSFRGDLRRDWDGAIPDYCVGTTFCGDRVADAEASGIYGTIEIGARIPTIRTGALEVFWIPRRVQMSVTQTVDTDAYKANFADLDASFGFRLTYDF